MSERLPFLVALVAMLLGSTAVAPARAALSFRVVPPAALYAGRVPTGLTRRGRGSISGRRCGSARRFRNLRALCFTRTPMTWSYAFALDWESASRPFVEH
ncbi:hypothetical protein AB0F72_38210 [Actinoplanes sp. NPDC023936]|uniref:hypothetical protein n=1 Tax=Actinoplanes sp. NPDC023936 TaxID=3154910 RepID=UPI0033CABF69